MVANMAKLKISVFLLGIAFVSVNGLSCAPCNPTNCNPTLAVNCQAGFTKDVCGCCDVCAKALGETCGGPWNIAGECGTDLKCEKQPEQGQFSNSFNTEGLCVWENPPEENPNWFDGYDFTGIVGIKFTLFSKTKITISKGITYYNGIEIREEEKDCYKVCGRIYMPVCGSDGSTYVNECAFLNEQCGNQNLRITERAPCGMKPPVDSVSCFKALCTRDYKPVCGSDGKTYSNECELNNAKCDYKVLRKVHDSLCVKVLVTTCTKPFCTLQYKPVCGSDGETYGNECLFNNAKCADQKLTIVSRKVCSETTTSTTYFKLSIHNGFDLSEFSGLQLSGFQGYTFKIKNGQTVLNDRHLIGSRCYTCCTLIYMPVCGSDGNTYPNECALRNAKCDDYRLYKEYNGKCGDIQYPDGTTCILAKCKGNIGDEFKVCGSDGKTYDSLCDFLNAKCKNTFLELTNIGSCVGLIDPISCYTPCTLIFKPVCGSDGATYSNDCMLNNAKCDNIFLYKVSDGPCGDCKSPYCTMEYFPICGSDGQTYGNECLFKNAQCDDESLQKKYNGECAELTPVCLLRVCLEAFKPVCGSDGITYSSECHLNNAKCENNLLKLAYKGRCEILWRFDFRCGRNYLLSSGKPAQCNPNSESAYCCSASGWCGHTDFHCSCKDCVNYKKINMDSLLLSAVIQLQGTCGHASNCRSTLNTLEQFVDLQKEHIKLLTHNDDLMSKRVVELEHQTRDASRKLTDLVAYHYDCLPPFVFLEPTKECLYFHTETDTYNNAKLACIRQAAEIAIPEDFNILSKYMKENGYGYNPEIQPFIGARYDQSLGDYVWENKTVIKSDNWDSKLDKVGNCVVYCPTCPKAPLTADSTTDCNSRRPYICKKRKRNAVSTSISLPSTPGNNNGNLPSGISGISGNIPDDGSGLAAIIAAALQDQGAFANRLSGK